MAGITAWFSQVANGLHVFSLMVSATNASRAITVRSGFKKIVATLRSKQDRSALTSFIIVDAQSVKNTETAENKGYDAGKKISGIKRHLAVDMNGFPQAIHLTRANVSDRDGASAMLALNAENLRRVRSVLVDGGYSGRNFAMDVQLNLKATTQVAKRNELHKFEVLPQRWIIERSFSWLENIVGSGKTVNDSCTPVQRW